MGYSVLGRTGVRVWEDLPGTANFGVAPTRRRAARIVGAALDLGINFVDTADVYGNLPVFDRVGTPPAAEREPAETLLGRALRGRRDGQPNIARFIFLDRRARSYYADWSRASSVLAAKQLGAEWIVVSSRHADRQALARDFGATDVMPDRGDEFVVK